MMWELVLRNLLHRPMRTFISVMAVGVEVALVILIVGLTSGLLTETAKRIEGIGADIVLQPPAASIFLNFSGSPMPIKIGDQACRIEICASRRSGIVAIQFRGRSRHHLGHRS